MYEFRVYSKNSAVFDVEPEPVVVLVATGEHDVSRLVNLFNGGQVLIEQLGIGKLIAQKASRTKEGRAALKLLEQHGGPDLLEKAISSEENSAKRQRAADRVSAFAEKFAKVEKEKIDLIDDYTTGETLLLSDLRLLVEAAPVLPPKWSAPLTGKTAGIAQSTGEDWTDAAARAREVLNALEARGAEADVFRDGLISLSAADLKTLVEASSALPSKDSPNIVHIVHDDASDIQFVGSTKEKAEDWCRSQGRNPYDFTSCVVDA
jgi:broad specificity phosphatase PhoE